MIGTYRSHSANQKRRRARISKDWQSRPTNKPLQMLTHLAAKVAAAPEVHLLIFIDGDGADDPQDLEAIITPIRLREVDFVIGSRALENAQRGALTLGQCNRHKLDETLLGRFFLRSWPLPGHRTQGL